MIRRDHRECKVLPPVRIQERLRMHAALSDCLLAEPAGAALPIYAVRSTGLPDLLEQLAHRQANYLRASGFDARFGQVVLLPGEAGLSGAVLGLGESQGPHVFGALPGALPAGSLWRLGPGILDPADAVLGFALGAYRFNHLRSQGAPVGARLLLPDDVRVNAALSAARATWMVRDLINMPANLLGPADLAQAAVEVMTEAGACVDVISGTDLHDRYPVLHAVGRGSARAPCVVFARWRPPGVDETAPLLSICGKGVCFDTGGYDLKPSAGMLRMKKDMGGAAIALGLARMIIDAALPVRLELRLGCVENMISGEAMRPLDILRTRRGVTIEVGNTDAEGRLVLCELLAEAAEEAPAALLDFATLTGAARAALGPDLPALFSNDDGLASSFTTHGRFVHDPVWQLPLWDGYNSWLDSTVADMNSVSEKGQAGAILAALFLQRFVPSGTRWAHFDVYAWNDTARPGAPQGGEAQAMRAAYEGLKHFVTNSLC